MKQLKIQRNSVSIFKNAMHKILTFPITIFSICRRLVDLRERIYNEENRAVNLYFGKRRIRTDTRSLHLYHLVILLDSFIRKNT